VRVLRWRVLPQRVVPRTMDLPAHLTRAYTDLPAGCRPPTRASG
jgi:hypothetical protein